MATRLTTFHLHADHAADFAVEISGVKDVARRPYRTIRIGPRDSGPSIALFLEESQILPWMQQVDSAIRAVMFEMFPPDENGDQ